MGEKYHQMNCEICKVNKAIIHITEIENGTYKEFHICQQCAENKEFEKVGEGFGPVPTAAYPKELSKLKCNFCGSTLYDISKKRLLGCANDYEVFKKILIPIIEKIHSAKKHKGKKPVAMGGKIHNLSQQIKELELQLKEAVKKEEYEKAAKIRDKINELNALLKKEQ